MKKVRKSYNLRQVDIAEKIDTSQRYYQHIEGGIQPPSIKMIFKFCKALNIHPINLFQIGNLGIIDKQGKAIVEKVDESDYHAFSQMVCLPLKDKKVIHDFINYKYFKHINNIGEFNELIQNQKTKD